MESLENKIKALGLLHVDTCPEAMVQSYEMKSLKNDNKNRVYFKMYGSTRMMFSVEYLLSVSLDVLFMEDKRNQRTLAKRY